MLQDNMIKFENGHMIYDASDIGDPVIQMGIENEQGQLVVDINDNGLGIWLSEDHR
jgi:hypothetical protein